MDSTLLAEIVSSSVVLVSVITSAFIAIYTIRHNDVTEKQKKTIKEIITNINGFHELEEIYIRKLIDLRTITGKNTFITHDAIIKETRKELREKKIDFDFSPSDIGFYKKVLM